MSYSFSKAEMHDLPAVLSAPRFATFLRATANKRADALALYQWNLPVSAAMFVPLHLCEIALRNGVAEALQRVHGANWPWSAGFVRSLPVPRNRYNYNAQADLTRVARRQSTTGKVIAQLRFAFWQQLFTAGQDQRLWLPHLRSVFPGVPANLSVAATRALTYRNIYEVRSLRNRIAHHEPIFARDLASEHARLREMIAWRSGTAAAWLDRVEGVTALLGTKPVAGS